MLCSRYTARHVIDGNSASRSFSREDVLDLIATNVPRLYVLFPLIRAERAHRVLSTFLVETFRTGLMSSRINAPHASTPLPATPSRSDLFASTVSRSSSDDVPRCREHSEEDAGLSELLSDRSSPRNAKTIGMDTSGTLDIEDEHDHLLAISDTAPHVARPVSPLGGGDEASLEREEPVTWSSIPRRDQLILLTLARLSEPLTQTSLQSYMFYQLKSFGPSLSDSTISSQAGLLQGSFTAAQFLTAIMWGRAADSEWFGRKRVILVGILGTAVSAVGFGFSRSFALAIFFRCLGGALNGNIGVMRTVCKYSFVMTDHGTFLYS